MNSIIARHPMRPLPSILYQAAASGNLRQNPFLTALAERAIYAGRPTLLGDGDRHNKGISQSPLYGTHGLPLPAADDRVTMQKWLTAAFGAAIERQKNLLLDIGGGDELVQEYAATTGLIEAGEVLGISVVGLFMYGTEPGDLDFIAQLLRSGKFNPTRSLIVRNEWAASEGMPPQRAFDEAGTSTRLDALDTMSVVKLRMPRMLAMNQVLASGLTFHDAADGKPGRDGKPLEPMERFWKKKWIGEIDAEIGSPANCVVATFYDRLRTRAGRSSNPAGPYIDRFNIFTLQT